MFRFFSGLAVAAAVVFSTELSFAQIHIPPVPILLNPPTTIAVQYFNTSTDHDNIIQLINPNTLGSTGSACAQIYVLDAKQTLQACCGCLISGQGLLTLSVKTNLTWNPYYINNTNFSPGVIVVASSQTNPSHLPLPGGSLCTPGEGYNAVLANLAAWINHNSSQSSVSEAFSQAPAFDTLTQSVHGLEALLDH